MPLTPMYLIPSPYTYRLLQSDHNIRVPVYRTVYYVDNSEQSQGVVVLSYLSLLLVYRILIYETCETEYCYLKPTVYD